MSRDQAMTMQDDTTNTPSTGQPTGLELDEILYAFQDWAEYSAGGYVNSNRKRLTFNDAKQALTRWGLEQQYRHEIKVLRDTADGFESELLPEFEKGGRAAINALRRIADHRESELQANLQDGGKYDL